jgi:hypothetical protein
MKLNVTKFIYDENFSFVRIILVLFLISSIGINVYTAAYLRPISDDYCLGLTAQFGLVGGVVHWWNTWSGNLLSMFLGNLTVGLPLLYFDFYFASAFPFLLASIGLSLTLLFISRAYVVRSASKILFSLVIICSWTVFVLAPKMIAWRGHESIGLSYGLLHWQTLNGTYVLQFMFLIWAVILVERGLQRRKPGKFLISSFGLFFILGTSGSAPSLAILSVVLLSYTSTSLSPYNVNTRCSATEGAKTILLVGVLGCITGMLVSHFSPGNIIRYEAVKPNIQFNLIEILFISIKSLLRSLIFVTKGACSLSGLMVFVLVSSCLRIFDMVDKNGRKTFFWSFILFLLFSVISSWASYFTGYLAYNGYWHQTTAYVSLFCAIVFSSCWFCTFINQMAFRRFILLGRPLLIGTICAVVFIQIETHKEVRLRNAEWVKGPAPVPYLSDLEGAWVLSCWSKLNQLRPQVILRK